MEGRDCNRIMILCCMFRWADKHKENYDTGLYLCGKDRSDNSKWVRGHVRIFRLKIAKKFCLYLDIFSYVRINVFRPFFTFRLEMHIRCDNHHKTGADGGSVLGQPMLFECNGICVLSPAMNVK